MKHAVKTAKSTHASCRLVYQCSLHEGEALPCPCPALVQPRRQHLTLPHRSVFVTVSQALLCGVCHPLTSRHPVTPPLPAADTLKQAEQQHTILAGTPADLLEFLRER